MLTFEQILAASGPNCGPTQDGYTSLALETAIGGIFDFVIGGLGVDIDPTTNVAIPATGYVVLPLDVDVQIPTNAFYQKFTDGTGWSDFVIDDDNGAIYSASSGGGDCPAIPADAEGNSEAYTAGLTVGDNCVLLSIVDGGANDADNKVNGQIVDPGTISRIAGDEGVVDNPSSSGGCTLSTETVSPFKHAEWLLLGGAVGWMAMRRRRQQKHSAVGDGGQVVTGLGSPSV